MFMESDQFTSQNCASKGWTRQQFYTVSAIVWPDKNGKNQQKIPLPKRLSLIKNYFTIYIGHEIFAQNFPKKFKNFHKIWNFQDRRKN